MVSYIFNFKTKIRYYYFDIQLIALFLAIWF